MNQIVKVALVLTACAVLGGAIAISLLYCKSVTEGLGLVASVATLIGLAYTAIQVWETKTLTRATKDAAEKAVQGLRGNEYRYFLMRANGLLTEIRTLVQFRNWRIATVRLHDLADQCLALARIQPGPDEQWREFSKIVRWWGNDFERGHNTQSLDFDQEGWRALYDELMEKVDRESQPFTDDESESMP